LRDFPPRFYLSRHSVLFVCAFLALAAAAVELAACHRALPGRPSGFEPALDGLAFLPDETEIVLSLDFDRLRGQPIWKTLSPALAKHASPALEEIASGTGLEAARQIHRIWIGLPAERQADGRFVLFAETDSVDTARATAWLQERGRGELAVSIPNSRQILVARGAWTHAIAGRMTRTAADNVELRRLCQRSAGANSLWFAAVVPLRVRRTLMETARLSDVATLVRTSGSLSDAAGLHAEWVGEFGNTVDPPLVAHRLRFLQNQAKRHPDMLVAGLSPYLEALHVEVRNASVRVAVDLPDAQISDVLERIEALARTPRTKYSPAP